MSPLRRALPLLAPAAAVVTAFMLGVFSVRPPAPVPAGAPAEVFSSGRAMAHVTALAGEPRPPGSAAHRRAREYLLRELRSLGLDPEVQAGFAGGLHLQNVLATFKGTASTRPLLLAAHYDSVPGSPGAADDASGCAVLLETLRALTARGPLRNDVVALFTDGEEGGLRGARLFADRHPLATQVGLVLNFEARGNSGPSIMFETSGENGALIREFAQAAPHPVANSLSYSVYRLLPNDTDLTIFKKAGLSGFNFAFIDGFSAYHRPADDPAGLSERSLQHQGENALALALRFGGLPLPPPREPDAVYFDLLGSLLARYPGRLVLPLAGLISALLAAVLFLGFRRQSLSGRGLLRGLRFSVRMLAEHALLPAVAALLLQRMLIWVLSLPPGVPWTGEWTNTLVVVSLFNANLAVNFIRLGRRRGTMALTELAAGPFLAWLCVLWASSVLLPGASYLFAWPILFALPGLAYLLSAGPGTFPSPGGRALLCALSLPPILLLAPAAYLLFLAMAYSLPVAVLIAGLIIQLCLGLLVPFLGALAARPGEALLRPTAPPAGPLNSGL